MSTRFFPWSLLLFVAFLLPSIHWGQTAVFTTDTSRMRIYDQLEVGAFRWEIHGKTLRYDGSYLEVPADSSTLDTLFFQKAPDRAWDTILCNIARPDTFEFYFNPCCGAFNMRIRGGKTPGPDVEVIAKCSGREMDLAASFGWEAVTKVKCGESSWLTGACRSAMSSNVSWFQLQEYTTPCPEGSDACEGGACLIEGGEILDYGFSFLPVKTYAKFLYLRLSPEREIIELDLNSGKLMIR